MRTIPLLVVLLAGCASTSPEGDGASEIPAAEDEGGATSGGGAPSTPEPTAPGKVEPAPEPGPAKATDLAFRVLTYNVAGLPEGVSKSKPATNSPLISPKLNPFDLVVVQEDFSYHDELVSQATHPHKSTPMKGGVDLGDGLNTLSKFAFTGFTRTKWSKCHGYFDSSNDCLTPKGFTRFVVNLGDGREIDVYDVHFDAGRGDGDYEARSQQVDQIVAVIASQSKGRAVIVAGDTNMKASDEPVFLELLQGAGLSCACRTLSCPEPSHIDRVLYRSSATVVLAPQKYAVESWLDPQGEPLSDHDPVSVDFVAKSP